MPDNKEDILNLNLENLEQVFKKWGEPKYRAQQVFGWLYRKYVDNFSSMSDLPRRIISRLNTRFAIGSLKTLRILEAADKTKKFIFMLEDGHSIETVFIPENRRRTICLSSQVGCKFGCPYCVSGSKGFVRQLTVSEIVEQILMVSRLHKERITNIVMMGIGEPLDNYLNLSQALKIINHPKGLRIGSRKITISTCGLVPGIFRLMELGLQIELSISLHATTDELRNRLVPVNRAYNLEKLLDACHAYYRTTGRVVTLEYVLIEGLNDSDQDARRLGQIARDLRAKVNLISCNPSPYHSYRGVNLEKMEVFKRKVSLERAKVTIRETRGKEIQAACGQLAIDEMGKGIEFIKENHKRNINFG